MKDWKTWALIIGLYLLVKMCGGCNGCGGSVPKPDLEELKKKIYYQTGWQPYQFNFEKLELSVEDPPIYEFEIRGPYGSHKTGQVSVYENGSIKNVSVY